MLTATVQKVSLQKVALCRVVSIRCAHFSPPTKTATAPPWRVDCLCLRVLLTVPLKAIATIPIRGCFQGRLRNAENPRRARHFSLRRPMRGAGPMFAKPKGACTIGKRLCGKDGKISACIGTVGPKAEVCGADNQDENCDGSVNEGCTCSPDSATESCGSTSVANAKRAFVHARAESGPPAAET